MLQKSPVFLRRTNDSMVPETEVAPNGNHWAPGSLYDNVEDDFNMHAMEINAIPPGCCFMMWILYVQIKKLEPATCSQSPVVVKLLASTYLHK